MMPVPVLMGDCTPAFLDIMAFLRSPMTAVLEINRHLVPQGQGYAGLIAIDVGLYVIAQGSIRLSLRAANHPDRLRLCLHHTSSRLTNQSN